MDQALWRGKLARRQYVARLTTEIKRRKSVLRYMYSCGDDLRQLERSALVIQRAWRARKLRQEWSRLLTSGKADLHTVVAHMHLLDIRSGRKRKKSRSCHDLSLFYTGTIRIECFYFLSLITSVFAHFVPLKAILYTL
jgi:hypothetical protein